MNFIVLTSTKTISKEGGDIQIEIKCLKIRVWVSKYIFIFDTTLKIEIKKN